MQQMHVKCSSILSMRVKTQSLMLHISVKVSITGKTATTIDANSVLLLAQSIRERTSAVFRTADNIRCL